MFTCSLHSFSGFFLLQGGNMDDLLGGGGGNTGSGYGNGGSTGTGSGSGSSYGAPAPRSVRYSGSPD